MSFVLERPVQYHPETEAEIIRLLSCLTWRSGTIETATPHQDLKLATDLNVRVGVAVRCRDIRRWEHRVDHTKDLTIRARIAGQGLTEADKFRQKLVRYAAYFWGRGDPFQAGYAVQQWLVWDVHIAVEAQCLADRLVRTNSDGTGFIIIPIAELRRVEAVVYSSWSTPPPPAPPPVLRPTVPAQRELFGDRPPRRRGA